MIRFQQKFTSPKSIILKFLLDSWFTLLVFAVVLFLLSFVIYQRELIFNMILFYAHTTGIVRYIPGGYGKNWENMSIGFYTRNIDVILSTYRDSILLFINTVKSVYPIFGPECDLLLLEFLEVWDKKYKTSCFYSKHKYTLFSERDVYVFLSDIYAEVDANFNQRSLPAIEEIGDVILLF